jgi:hypothetical protein
MDQLDKIQKVNNIWSENYNPQNNYIESPKVTSCTKKSEKSIKITYYRDFLFSEN